MGGGKEVEILNGIIYKAIKGKRKKKASLKTRHRNQGIRNIFVHKGVPKKLQYESYILYAEVLVQTCVGLLLAA